MLLANPNTDVCTVALSLLDTLFNLSDVYKHHCSTTNRILSLRRFSKKVLEINRGEESTLLGKVTDIQINIIETYTILFSIALIVTSLSKLVQQSHTRTKKASNYTHTLISSLQMIPNSSS